MIPFFYILWVLLGELKAAKSRETGVVAELINKATIILLGTWMVSPITYLFPVFFEYPHDGAETVRQVGYTIADITAKALYGLAIVSIAKARSGNHD
jgi:hypothetical protein